jgi:L-lactate dehydrogenase
LADATRMLGHDRVLSTGTYRDSLRFRFHLARRLGVSLGSVNAQILGERGTSEVFVWSSARISGVPVLKLPAQSGDPEKLRRDVEHEVRYANITIIEGIGASQHGICMVFARIGEMVSRDERAQPPRCYLSTWGALLRWQCIPPCDYAT